MIDFTNYKVGSKVNMTLSDDNVDALLCVIVNETEWSPNRKPYLINLKIDESTDIEKWPKDSTMLLEVNLDEEKELKFLLKCPTKLQPNKTLHKKAKIKLKS